MPKLPHDIKDPTLSYISISRIEWPLKEIPVLYTHHKLGVSCAVFSTKTRKAFE